MVQKVWSEIATIALRLLCVFVEGSALRDDVIVIQSRRGEADSRSSTGIMAS